MTRSLRIVGGLGLALIAACGGGDSFRCNLDAATSLAESDWPMSRHDPANTGRIVNAAVSKNPPFVRCIFPEPAGEPLEAGLASACTMGGAAIETTAIVGAERLVLATRSGRVHLLEPGADETAATVEIELDNPIDFAVPANSPLLGSDETIFVTDTSGNIRRFAGDTGIQLIVAPLQSEVIVAPNIGPDGVIYAGTVGGLFAAVCTNTAPRFQVALGGVSVPAAITVNPTDAERTIVLAAGDNGRLQGFDDDRGSLLWSFFTAGRLVRSAVVVDESRGIFILPDSEGRIYAGSLVTGQPRRVEDGTDLIPYRIARCVPSGDPCTGNTECGDGETCVGEVITASGALGTEHFYVATEGPRSETGLSLGEGSIHAFSLEFAGDGADWTFRLPQRSHGRSSPIVAIDGNDEIVIVGADLDCDDVGCAAGAVLALSEGELLWMVELPDPVGTASPSIRRTNDGAVVYLGTAGGELYEIR